MDSEYYIELAVICSFSFLDIGCILLFYYVDKITEFRNKRKKK